MTSTRCGFVLLVSVLCAVFPARADEPKLTKPEVAKRARPAVAFVVAKVELRPRVAGTAQGSAFCVHPSGLFVTNAHVVKGATEIQLVLNPSEKDEKVHTATVVRTAEADDLALLRVEAKDALPALPLGDDATLVELADVVACGYPFGSALTFGAKDFPSITTTAGAISSLRKKDGRLELIQLDVTLNPGNSGGPVLDMTGKVVGVAVGGIKGTQLNFAIPVRHVAAFLAKPEFTFTPPAVRPADRGKPVRVEARLASFAPGAAAPEVELEVRSGKAVSRHVMTGAGGVYRADVVLLPERKGAVRLTAEATFADGSLVGPTADREVKVGGVAHKLSEVRTVSPYKGQVVLWSGGRIEGKVTGLEAMPITLGGKEVTVDLSAAQEVTFRPPGEDAVLTLEVVARSGGKELGRISRSVLLDETNKVYLTELEMFDEKPGPWPLAIGKPGEPNGSAPIKVGGKLSPKGLGMHSNDPPASARFRLGKAATVFRATASFDDSNEGRVTVPTHFEVYGDGKLLWKSKAITSHKQTDDCLIDVTGVDVLELRVGSTAANVYGASAVWFDPILIGPDAAAIRKAGGKK